MAPLFAQVTVEDPWVRGTVPKQQATGAFMMLTAETDARLVAAESPVAGVVEIHEMAMENDVMKMREIPALDLPAGQTMELKPGGYHVMLMQLKEQMVGGTVVPITLIFEDSAGERFTQEIEARVTALGAAREGADKPMQHQHGHRH
ncbi:copper chaperone PCu(A)C [Azoarcus taiwanensis]|uniref:Copper chaperone PCu(A)C n=2 Tax=Azoarcus taiwanensis TaxID=666964 RepID=A0A972FG74_9RHOO|nr:copper chaperone PCu(A)C [Azoarcus taiwanensis]NMG04983.1 copper chaperone PCu(A)C [Azoarcus taiwanensis]